MMNIGMLWFDNNPKTDLASKVSEAASYYQKKYGRRPNLCFVHPSLFGQDAKGANGIEVRPNLNIQRNHLWLGLEELPH